MLTSSFVKRNLKTLKGVSSLQTITDKDTPEQKRVEALKEIFENLAPWKTSVPVSDQLTGQTSGAVIRGKG